MKLSKAEQESVMSNRFSFVNVWRSIVDEPIQVKPLAVCDARSVDPSEAIPYEMHYADRIGGNYALAHNDQHKWYYYPEMKKDECLLFKVYEKDEERTQSVYHTAFEDPRTPDDAPTRHSIECRTICCFAPVRKPVFYDMKHSNNAARIRLWLRLKQLTEQIETKTITYADLQDPKYAEVNPLKKVPAY